MSAPTARGIVHGIFEEYAPERGTLKYRFHLRDACGLYLHMSGAFLTPKRADAWIGTGQQARACRAKFPAAKHCKLRRVIRAKLPFDTAGAA